MINRNYRLTVQPPYVMSFYDFLEEDNKGIPVNDGYLKFMQDRRYSMSQIKSEDYLSLSRLISTWLERGLLNEAIRDNKGNWKRFSIQDLLWIRIIFKLRSFGLSHDCIEVVKQFLFTDVHLKEGSLLFPYCIGLVKLGAPLDLIVFPDGEAHILNEPRIKLEREKLIDYISISLNEIVKEVAPNLYSPPKYGHSFDLTDDEFAIWSLIRFGDYKKVEIFLQDGKVERYEATQQVELNTRIGDLLKDGNTPFESIQVQKTDGKVVSIKRTITKKLK